MAYLPGRKRLGPRRLFHDALTCPHRRKSSPRRAHTEEERLKDAWEAVMAAPPVVNPFQIIFQEHAKYMVAIKELQSQVQVLHQFRTRVLQAFPQLDASAPYGGMPTKAAAPMGAGTLTTLPSPRKPGVISKSGRILPSVQKVQPTPIGRHTVTKPQAFVGQAASSPVTSSAGRTRRNGERATWGSKKFVVVAQGKNWMRIRPCAKKSDSEMDDSDDASSDSLHSMEPQDKRKAKSKRKGDGTGPRQDSGFSTDGKERHHQERSSDGRWLKVSSATEDELMNVLELIGQKSKMLRTQVDKAELTSSQGPTLGDIGLKPDDILTEIERLHVEKEQLLERLVMSEAEKEMYKGEMIRMRDALIDSEANRKGLEERLEAAYTEREQLGTRIHHLHTQFRKSNGQDPQAVKGELDASGKALWTSGALKSPVQGALLAFDGSNSLPDQLSHTKLKVHLDKSKVSAILSESRTLELQRQLLESMLRNEVLKTQMNQSLADWKNKMFAWQQTEQVLQSDADMLRESSTNLQSKLQHAETELREERSKRQVLERALQAAYKDLTSANSRQESVPPTENVRQLSVELFPVHQMAMNNSSGKFSDRSSPMTWRPLAFSSVATATTPSMARSSAPVVSTAATELHHSSKTLVNGRQDLHSTNGMDQPTKPDHGSTDAYGRNSGELEDEDTLTNLCTRMRPLARSSSNLSWRKSQEVGGASRTERQPKTNTYLMNGHSPNSRMSVFGPKFSQSAEDLRPSEWEWALGANQRLVNMSQRMPMSEAAS